MHTTDSCVKARQRHRGFSLVELLIVIAVIAILASMGVPRMLASRMAANEASAISSLRVISEGMEAWRVRNSGGDNRYPTDYKDLGAGIPPNIDPNLASGTRSGYAFSGGGDAQSWSVNAVPIRHGATGEKSFYVDETGIIRGADHYGGPAGPEDPRIE